VDAQLVQQTPDADGLRRRQRFHHRDAGQRGKSTLMFYLLQGSIMSAAMSSNLHWHYTPNGYIPALLGAALAYGVTRLLLALRAFVARHDRF
jgi:hypothetical protein